MMITGNTYLIEAQIKSPMGWVKVQVSLILLSDTAFFRSRKAYGLHSRPDGMRKKAARIFILRLLLKLPFGVLRVEINADVAEDGTVTGIANAPRHRPMEIKGQLGAVAAQ